MACQCDSPFHEYDNADSTHCRQCGHRKVVLAAHQPNFFPYSGVLDKARRCDVFVLLGHVQFTRGNYHNRFNLGNRWYTMGVNQALEPLVAKRYNDPHGDWQAIKRKLPAYARILDGFDDCIGSSLVDTNAAIIRRLFEHLGIVCRVVTDYPTELSATARLVDLCQHYGADAYLSGPSGRKYLDVAPFGAAGINVEWQGPVEPKAAVELLVESEESK